jgi:hypothetical protein
MLLFVFTAQHLLDHPGYRSEAEVRLVTVVILGQIWPAKPGGKTRA